MEKIIVTTGEPFTDIDSLACAIAYGELLNKENKSVEVILPGPLNASVTKTVYSWNLDYKTDFNKDTSQFVLVDFSNPEVIPSFVDKKCITELFDHHFGFENYWKNILGKNVKIEKVGACATLIWEEFKKRKQDKNISRVSADLLYTAIFSNTLNFKASVTTRRDIRAFDELKQYSFLNQDWIELYFTELEQKVYEDPRNAIINDTKKVQFPKTDKAFIIGQIELWNSRYFVSSYKSQIEKELSKFDTPYWFMNSPSISEGKNYLYTKNGEVKNLLEKTIDAKFNGDVGTTKKLWLRKEILKMLQ
jgi:inorganic pyrophosphatase/exopolyphosphatase